MNELSKKISNDLRLGFWGNQKIFDWCHSLAPSLYFANKNFGNKIQKLRKSRYRGFLALPSLARVLYGDPHIFSVKAIFAHGFSFKLSNFNIFPNFKASLYHLILMQSKQISITTILHCLVKVKDWHKPFLP